MFEEEDFQPAVYGYNLATQFNDSKTNSMLRECEDELNKKMKQLTKTESDVTPTTAILARIKFMRVFYSLLCHIWKRENNLQETSRLVQSSLDCLATMESTHGLGIKRSTDERGKLPSQFAHFAISCVLE